MTEDRQTLDVYARQAGEYSNLVAGDADFPNMPGFLALMPDIADILDLGCGPGRAAAAMRDLGHRVTALDASAEMAQVARDRYGLEVQVASFDALDAQHEYDGIWANFSLLHAPKSDMPRHLKAIARALRPGGALSIGLKTGTGEKRDSLGRFYAYYEDAEITALLGDAGLSVTDRITGAGPGLDGEIAPWIILTARKPASA